VGAAQILQELDVHDIQYAKYCDEALLKIKREHIEVLLFNCDVKMLTN
jgi:hypothetical protein